jgi:uncharacterized protein
MSLHADSSSQSPPATREMSRANAAIDATSAAAQRAAGSVRITVAGEAITLLPQRAALWEPVDGPRTLLISDLHLGKVETFASVGVPLPDVMHHQLAELHDVIRVAACERVLILGDLLHAPAGLTPLMLDTVRAWREQCPCAFDVVPGNHDRHIHKIADWWKMRLLGDVHRERPFAFTHEPRPIAGAFTWAGHVHPVVRLRSASDTLKLWCFVIDEARGVAILPAFCDFTSGGRFERASGMRVFAIAEQTVLEV